MDTESIQYILDVCEIDKRFLSACLFREID